jgi:4-diphosphocytidyl-2-C-methyl-D-erythritol kinase
MTVTVRSFAKINLGLRIGPLRPDGFHELRTVYQTIALHDIVRVKVGPGTGIEIRCEDPRVPRDESNTCYRVVERAMDALKARGRVIIEIEKRLPVQGGLGGASGNAVAALVALERALKKELPGAERLRIAAEVGSDLPLFLVGGTVLGVGRGEEVYPLQDLPPAACVIALPEVAVSTPKAFAQWDARFKSHEDCHSESASADEESAVMKRPGKADSSGDKSPLGMTKISGLSKLTHAGGSGRMLEFSRMVSAWLSAQPKRKSLSGVPASGRGRAETSLLDLVQTGIENDFEQVVFPQYPELREAKRVLERAGAFYASLSGSGSAIYGLFTNRKKAEKAASRLRETGVEARITTTLTRRQYWKQIFD